MVFLNACCFQPWAAGCSSASPAGWSGGPALVVGCLLGVDVDNF